MRYSPNLSIIIKALDKISGRLARDFGEIENLQNNYATAVKFANACYQRIKDGLIQDLTKIHPEYNIEFLDGERIINNPAAEYNYIISPVDGLINLSRSIPYFSTMIALEHIANGKKEVVAVALSNVASNELYFSEKGSGAFLNNRRVRVSENKSGSLICAVSESGLAKDKFISRLNNCFSLDIAYLAAGKIDLAIFNIKHKKQLRALFLLAKESGASVSERDDTIIVSNGKISLS